MGSGMAATNEAHGMVENLLFPKNRLLAEVRFQWRIMRQ
jgi:hypothetical protein